MFISFIIWLILRCLLLRFFWTALINATATSRRFFWYAKRVWFYFSSSYIMHVESTYLYIYILHVHMSVYIVACLAAWQVGSSLASLSAGSWHIPMHYTHPHVRGLARECCATLLVWKTNHPSLPLCFSRFVRLSLSLSLLSWQQHPQLLGWKVSLSTNSNPVNSRLSLSLRHL